MVFLVGDIDINGRMREQHARILQARRLRGCTCEMQHGATEMVECVHFESGGDVFACPRFAGARTLAGLRVSS